LIRDVLMNQDAYKEFLIHAYEAAWEDGVISEEEMTELKSFQEALGVTDEEAAAMNVKAAIKSAAADGTISSDEEASLQTAAEMANMTKDELESALKEALEPKDE